MDSSHEQVISALELMSLVHDRLAAGQTIRGLRFKGVSMLPMLRQATDTVEVTAVPEKLRKYDLPVYKGANGKYVMHRIVRVEENYYVCIGDNTYQYEHVDCARMVAVVTAFTRGQKRISVEHPGYKLYTRIWVAVYPVRRFIRRVLLWLRRHLK